jgi:N-acetylglucosamine-6-sulfatase
LRLSSGAPAIRAALLAAALGSLLAIGVGVPAAAPAAETERPNIVVIMTDDQRLDDLYSGSGRTRVMPQILDRVGAAGVTFSRSYVSYSLSCPSRSTFLTGRYAHNHGVTANVFPGFAACGTPGIFPAKDSLGLWLQGAGYFTIIAGRYLNGYPSPISTSRTRMDPGWNRWYVPVTVRLNSAATFYDYFLNENGVVTRPTPGALHEDSAYFSDVIADRAAASIEVAPEAQPVFVFLSHRAPHEDDEDPEGPAPAARHDLFGDALAPPRLPSFNEKDLSDKPAFFQEAQERLVFGETRQITVRGRRRLASLRAVDDSVETIVEALQRTGRLDNTYFFFTSDNGFLLGEHRLPKGKIRPYEQSTRVPLMVAGPGIPAGRISEELVSNIDIPTTILDLAGARPTTPPDGRSLLPFLRDPSKRSGRPLLLHSFRDDSPEGVGTNPRVQAATFKAIVRGRYKLVLYDKGEGELYDLERDPHELENLYLDPGYAATRRYLERELSRLQRCLGAGCREEIGEPPGPSGPPR